jgi:hypothetical protein
MGSYDLTATASAFHQGVLAAKVSSILARTGGADLPDADVELIRTGAHLVNDILAGARTLTEDAFSGASAHGISSLGFALSPLERLRLHCGGGEDPRNSIVTVLSEISAALCRTATEKSVPAIQGSVLAQHFFDYLADAVLSSLSRHDLPSQIG